MTDKERLEEIEVKYSILTVSSEKNGIEYTEVDVEDLVFLIQNGFKQTEHVERLEEREKIYKEIIQSYGKIADGFVDDIESLVKRNKHYKHALEFYADEENYCVRFEDDYEPILQDNGKTARQALGWEEEK